MTDTPADESAIERQLRYQMRKLVESKLQRLERIDPRLRAAAEAEIGALRPVAEYLLAEDKDA